MTAETFCAIFLDACSGVTGFTIPADYMDMAVCVTSYMSLTEEQKMCRSYHVCSVATFGADPHCLHSVGIGTCL